jgi:hypothetical protein
MVHCIKVQQILFAGCVASWCSLSLSLSLVIIRFESPKHNTHNHKALQSYQGNHNTLSDLLHDGWVGSCIICHGCYFQWLFLLCGRKQALVRVCKPGGINSRFCHLWTSPVESTADSAMCGQAWWNQQLILPCVDKHSGINSRFARCGWAWPRHVASPGMAESTTDSARHRWRAWWWHTMAESTANSARCKWEPGEETHGGIKLLILPGVDEPGEGIGMWQNRPLSTSLLVEPGEVAPGRISNLMTLLLEWSHRNHISNPWECHRTCAESAIPITWACWGRSE